MSFYHKGFEHGLQNNLNLSDLRGVLFAIPLSKLIANVFWMTFHFQNLMVFQVEGIQIAY